ncbi:family 10 glycosylhydrolase [Portibacter lacus]|uniref:family 10 glycosylhydrolase n=1 Tax=Portibacter lacus TaxID=1099794 RepID=UPI001F2F1F76|nr:family 10 glycosylhydrolase [Portibacter lacus]
MSIINVVSHAQIPGEEFRASWLTTVYNIDWPSTKNDVEAQKQEFQAVVERAVSTKMNAILLQIRPNADALYQSAYEPWSEWLTGTRGKDPGYDPLAYAISEAHKHGIELHAWLNPYRFEISAGDYAGLPGDYASSNPEWILDVGGKTYFNPGLPEVTDYIKHIVGDIVGKYDLDGICFDDYFYPSDIILEDQEAFTTHGNGLSIRDFRRASVNQMIASVHDTIKTIKPYLRFGVSPAGIYSTDPSAAAAHNTTLPAGISGRDNYNAIYCDPLAWMESGSVDYLSPQLYWQIGGGQDFHTLNDWWEAECNKYDVQFFPSLATYRLSNSQPPSSSADGWELNEIINQIQYLRANTKDNGMIFFSNSNLEEVEMLAELLSIQVFNNLSIWPEFGNSPSPSKPSGLKLDRFELDATSSVFWTSEKEDRYLIEGLDANNETTIKRVSYSQNVKLPFDTITEQFKISSINQYGKINGEFSPLTIPTVEKPEIVSFEGDEVSSYQKLTWKYAKNSSGYIVSISEDETFSTDLFNSGLIQDTFIIVEDIMLEGNQTYFWRVLACNGKGCEPSQIDDFFTGFPIASRITSPIDGEIHVPLLAEIQWEMLDEATSYDVQIATDSMFNAISQEGSINAAELPYVSDQLNKWTDYYVRVRGLNEAGKGQWSDGSGFKTTTDIPDAPMFVTPQDMAEFGEDEVEISWTKSDLASGYKLNIAMDEAFEQVVLDSAFSQYKRNYTFDFPDKGAYYVRVCSEYVGGCGDWSNTLQFSSITSSVFNSSFPDLKIYPNPVDDHIFIKNLIGHVENSGYSIAIMNTIGQKVMEKSISSAQDTLFINVHHLNNGIYFLRLVDQNGNIKAIGKFSKL